ncbi:toxic anion resistance protein [Roseomonas stagni]|uniref:Toxic anion resistance protein n=1 Tax=Falsiroseomonas algicola TaxID=2716930 RepID=A0A6M1LDP7_9PROT|nr:toxic anion resistance protein [Falsiroseomonas algicola]NGM18413.1 toxic anion resistance protein [Falsiroseomonas algicola]
MSTTQPTTTPPGTPVAEIDELARQIDLSDPGSILRFGQQTQTRAQAAADAMLEGARNQETGEAGRTLSSLLSTLRGFDVTKLDERPGFFARVFTKAGAEVTGIIQKYETVKGQIEGIGDKLDTHRTRLLEDVERLERLYQATLEWFHALGDHVQAGEAVLARTDKEAIPAMEAAVAANPGDDLAPQRLRDLRGARDELDRRVHDLRLTRQVAMQALPSIRLIQENDKALASKIHSVLANTVPLWRQQLAQALAIHRMREAGSAVKQATDLTNQLLTANAETLRRGNLEARTELERGIFDLAAVQKANAALVSTIEDSLRIADEARGQRARAAEELAKLEGDIRRVLVQAKAGAPVTRPV